MSMLADGKRICCNGDGGRCGASASLPVALRPTLGYDLSLSEPGSEVEGWLFVMEHNAQQHFCPRCAPTYLASMPVVAGRSTREQSRK